MVFMDETTRGISTLTGWDANLLVQLMERKPIFTLNLYFGK